MFRISRHSYAQVVPVTLVTAALCAFIGILARGEPLLLLTLVGPLVLWAWVIWFFRDPHRRPPAGADLFVSPADGVVTDITPLGPDSPLGCAGVQVGVFMSVFDVHVNRSPCEGAVQSVDHRRGLFMDVRRPEAWGVNECATIYMTHRGKPVVVRQIAGLLARRIVSDVGPGKELSRGERIGMIKFGSRVELMVSQDLSPQPQVAVGRHVLAGETVLLKVRSE
jgi:phosphatidylserine decarboxylase